MSKIFDIDKIYQLIIKLIHTKSLIYIGPIINYTIGSTKLTQPLKMQLQHNLPCSSKCTFQGYILLINTHMHIPKYSYTCVCLCVYGDKITATDQTFHLTPTPVYSQQNRSTWSLFVSSTKHYKNYICYK